ncbi:MAG: ABC transporter permease subunit [Acholeplasmataceae bacterium]|nr:ABC transporter permease subunit [Acholeplasmataceae bacterium]
MNWTLFKATLKANYKVLIIIFLILMMYSSIIIGMYDPSSMEAWDAMLSLLPESLLKAMNFTMDEASFLGYIAGYYYGFIIVMFPLIYIAIIGQRMIARYVDTGSMSFLLATPNTRKKIATTQGLYLFVSTMVLLILTALMILIFGILMFRGELSIGRFIILNLNVIALFVLLSGIAFLASAAFNEVRLAVSIGAGIPFGFFIVEMLSGVSEDLSFLRYFTPFTLFNTSKILASDSIVWLHMGVLVILGLICYIVGVYIFDKKDLHI